MKISVELDNLGATFDEFLTALKGDVSASGFGNHCKDWIK